jgi:hypothetical protein
VCAAGEIDNQRTRHGCTGVSHRVHASASASAKLDGRFMKCMVLQLSIVTRVSNKQEKMARTGTSLSLSSKSTGLVKNTDNQGLSWKP